MVNHKKMIAILFIYMVLCIFPITNIVYAEFENLYTYTEDDPPNKWEITDSVTATFTQYQRKDSSVIWKYKGDDVYSYQFTVTAWIRITEISAGDQTCDALNAVALQDLEPKVDDLANWRYGAVAFAPYYNLADETQYFIHFHAWLGGLERVSRYLKVLGTSNNYDFQVGTTYYIKFMRNNAIFRCQAFSDPLFMNLIADSYESTASYWTLMNYSYVDIGWLMGGEGQPNADNWMSGWIKNINIIPAYNMTEIPFGYKNSTLINFDGSVNDGWIFKGEVYHLTSYIWNLTEFYINFTDGIHEVRFRYFNNTKKLDVIVSPQEQFVIGLIGTSYEEIGNYSKLTWKFIPDINIVDSLNVDFYYWGYNEQYDVTFDGDTGIDVNIYNLGGFWEITTDNATLAYRIVGGDGFDLFNSGFNESVEASAIFRKLQHVHLNVEWEQDNYYNPLTGYYSIVSGNWCDVYFEFDYRLNGSWVEGWKAHIEIEGGGVGNGLGGNDMSYEVLNVTWYNRGKYVKSNNITSYHYGYDVDSQPTERRSVRLWIDLWFNRLLIDEANVVGGRVNAYYNGMKEFGNPWWFGYGNFRPMMSNVSASMFFDTLKNANNNTMSIHNIDLVKFKIGINKELDFPIIHDMKLHQYQIFNYKQADDRMEGIDTPIFVEPEDISMPKSGGFLAPLYKAIEGLSTAIWKASLGFVKIFIGAIDTILLWMNSPVTMSQMIQFIMLQASNITTWMQQLLLRVSDMLNVIAQMIIFVAQIIVNTTSAILWILIYVTAFPLVVLRFIIAIINGEPYTLYGHVFDFTNTHEIISAGLQLAPTMIGFMFVCWIVFGDIYMEKNDVEGIPKRILQMFGYMKEAYNSVYWIFNRIRNEIISLYNFIRSHIPSMGGGGGEAEEG